MLSASCIRAWFVVHKWTSLISTLFLLMLCITGLPLIFYHEIDHALGASVDPPELPGVTSVASVDRIVDAARARRPQDHVQFVSRDPDEPNAWFVSLGKTPDAPEASAFYTFDARTGDLTAKATLPWYVAALLISQPLHFGDYGGLPLKILWALLDLIAIVVLGSGVYLWIAKRKLSVEARLRALRNDDNEGVPEATMASSEQSA